MRVNTIKMSDFTSVDKLAQTLPNSDAKIRVYGSLVAKAKIDSDFRKTIDFDRLSQVESDLNISRQTTGLRIAILGYKSDLVPPWDPLDTVKGLPGSEECAVYGSQELANRGHIVDLYLDPPKQSIWRSNFSNPRWLSVDDWLNPQNMATYDLVLMWRRFDIDTGRLRGRKVFFWGHDSPPRLPPGTQFPMFPKFDGNLILSKHHRQQFSIWPGFDIVPYIISGNGIVPEQFSNPMQITNPYSMGYFSNYSRGLEVLLYIWQDIRKEFPQATLDICYGREHWGTMSDQQLQALVSKIEAYKSLGVTEHGKIGHLELAKIMQSTSIFTYPCLTMGETYCITAIKCQAAGCIPVTTRIAALNETVHPEAPSIPLITDLDQVNEYKELLLNTLRRIRDSDPEVIKSERNKYIEFTRNHSWSACVDKWLQLYSQVK